MKVQELLELQEVITKKETPSDMDGGSLQQHYSTSKDIYIPILDMDLIHLVRSYSKCLGSHSDEQKELKSQDILNNLDVIENRLSTVKELFKNSY